LREVDGKLVPLPLLIQACDKKDFQEIHSEVQAAKRQRVLGKEDFVLGEESERRIGLTSFI
jgi:hypothetical protein